MTFRRKSIWIPALGGLLAGASVGSWLIVASAGEPSPTATHTDQSVLADASPPYGQQPSNVPAVVTEARDMELSLRLVIDPDRPCPGGPCLGGPPEVMAQAVATRCTKVGNGEFTAANPGLPDDHAYVRVDQAIKSMCEELTGIVAPFGTGANPEDVPRLRELAERHLVEIAPANEAARIEQIQSSP